MNGLLAEQSICDNTTISSPELGRNVTVFSTGAESISDLQTVCYKQIHIPGSYLLKVSVPTADFGFNKYYEYGGLNGVTNARAYDVIMLHTGTCDAISKTQNAGLKISAGLTTTVNGSAVCLKIVPELEHRNLGGHRTGGMVNITVEVLLAACGTNNGTLTPSPGSCVHMCSTEGQVNKCPNQGTIMHMYMCIFYCHI